MREITDLSNLDDTELATLYSWPSGPSLRLSMLIGPDGESTGPDGTSHSLTSSLDRRVLRTIRADADGIIVGASSVRSEGWFLPQNGHLIVLSKTGDLPWETCPEPARVVVCHSAADVIARIDNHPGRYLCDGGFTTARALDAVRGFDDIALTSHIEPGRALALVTNHVTDYQLAHIAISKNEGTTPESFLLWRRAEPIKE